MPCTQRAGFGFGLWFGAQGFAGQVYRELGGGGGDAALSAPGTERVARCLEILYSERTQGFAADPDYGKAKCLPMLGEIKT